MSAPDFEDGNGAPLREAAINLPSDVAEPLCGISQAAPFGVAQVDVHRGMPLGWFLASRPVGGSEAKSTFPIR